MSDAAAEDRIRPITKIVKLGAIAIIKFPIIKVTNVQSNIDLALKRCVTLTRIGPQMANVKAYNVTSWPMTASDTCKSWLIKFIIPATIISTIPTINTLKMKVTIRIIDIFHIPLS
ncbi:Uncharacterised protein [Streptococcus pneumoniae]|nr:Uncharacterised protein [Streptococcus pneumoniae]